MSNIKHFFVRLLMCCCIFSFFDFASASQITVAVKNKPLREVIKEIEKNSDYRFFYNDELSGLNEVVSIEIKDSNIEAVLEQIACKTSISYALRDNHQVVLFARNEKPQPQQSGRTVSGTVADDSGETLIGVNITVKGTTLGTVTDLDGKFSLAQIQEGAVLVVSYVGYITQEIRIGNNLSFKVVLKEDTQSLEEVVVVGYGTQKKQTLSGSVTSINADEIATTKSENVISNIQGKMPGLLIRQQTGEPGVFDNMVSIRGYGTPLIVIDGVTRPLDSGTKELAQLNSDDIESISILKDASAAIYGMNAANGVIIVTTKKGQDGKTRVSYSNLFGMKAATGMEFTVDAYTYRVMANEMQRNIGATATYSDEILQKYRNNEPGYTDHNWLDMFLHDWAFQQQHTISVRGGTDKIKYFNSFAYTEDNGLLKGGDQFYNRFNFRSNTTAELAKGLQLNVSVSGRLDNSQAPRDEFQWVYKILMINDRGKDYHTIANENHLTAIDPENKNAYALADPDIDGYRRFRNLQYQTTAELTYKVPFVKGLSVGVLGSFDGLENNESKLHKTYKLYDYYTDDYVVTNGAGTYTNTLKLYQKVHARGQINYTRTFHTQHNLSLLGVAELTSTRYDGLEGARRYAEFFTHDIIDQGTATTASNSGKREYTRLAAYLGRANYDFAGKYLLEVVARYDGSYRYAPSQRWAFFPSASLGWRISEEPFIKHNFTFVNNLKLRGSYGKSGRDAGNPFEYVAGYTAQSARGYVFTDGELTTGMIPPGVVNDNLTWITSITSNAGLDFEFLNGWIGGAVDVFQRKNTGLLATRIQSVPNTFGASFPQENINSEMNRGIEISLTHRNKIGKDFSYTAGVNATYARLKILHSERAPFTSSMDRWKNGNENRYTGRMWMYTYTGQYTSLQDYETAPLMGTTQGNSKMLPGSYKITDVNGDGIIDGNDQLPDFWTYGAVNPPIQYGMTLTANYKSFDVNMLFQGAAGYTINYRNNDIWGYGRYPTLHEKFLDRWHTTAITDDPYNPATTWISGFYPALRSNTNNTTDQYLIDVWRPNAAYLRLKNIELGYSIPRNVIRKVGLSSARVYVNGYNLLTFCRRELRDADPERQERSWDANAAYPLMKSYNLGININF